MEREVDINAISDGRRYTSNDLVKVGCNDCRGCSDCCKNMDRLITLDPYDMYRLTSHTETDGFTFERLMKEEYIELMVDKGIIVPALKMNEKSGNCAFLNKEGRCSIHDKRPGICRLFPMGRVYEEGSFYYFLQKDECSAQDKTKVKLKKWLDTQMLARYEQYICDWHYFIKALQQSIESESTEVVEKLNMMLLQLFYIMPYEQDFYQEFESRLSKMKSL